MKIRQVSWTIKPGPEASCADAVESAMNDPRYEREGEFEGMRAQLDIQATALGLLAQLLFDQGAFQGDGQAILQKLIGYSYELTEE